MPLQLAAPTKRYRDARSRLNLLPMMDPLGVTQNVREHALMKVQLGVPQKRARERKKTSQFERKGTTESRLIVLCARRYYTARGC